MKHTQLGATKPQQRAPSGGLHTPSSQAENGGADAEPGLLFIPVTRGASDRAREVSDIKATHSSGPELRPWIQANQASYPSSVTLHESGDPWASHIIYVSLKSLSESRDTVSAYSMGLF